MSASDQIRMMLDQLMGTARAGEESKTKISFEDSEVCKSFLLGCCPHDLLSSTRMDLGECRLMHEIALRSDYERASKHKDYYYDIDTLEHLERFLNDCDMRVEQSKRKLKENQEELSGDAATLANKIHDIGEQIGTQLVKAEELGAEGKVDESLGLMAKVDEMKKQKLQVELEYRNMLPMSSYQQQTLRVCEVCGAFLGIYDNDRRLADHFGGKLHVGFIVLRQKFEELKVDGLAACEERKKQRQKERERDRGSSRRDRERSRDRSGERSRERSRGERGREERGREERSKKSSHKRSRSRSRDRKKKHKHSSSSHRSHSKEENNRTSGDHY